MKPGGHVAWLDVREAAAYLSFRSVKTFYSWLDAERRDPNSKVKVHWLRGRMRFRAHELDRCLVDESTVGQQEPKPLRAIQGGRR